MENHEDVQNGRNGNSSKTQEKPKIEKTEKKANSWDRAGVLSKLFFTWTIPMFWKGLKKDLNTGDLRQPAEGDYSEPLADELEKFVVVDFFCYFTSHFGRCVKF